MTTEQPTQKKSLLKRILKWSGITFLILLILVIAALLFVCIGCSVVIIVKIYSNVIIIKLELINIKRNAHLV